MRRDVLRGYRTARVSTVGEDDDRARLDLRLLEHGERRRHRVIEVRAALGTGHGRKRRVDRSGVCRERQLHGRRFVEGDDAEALLRVAMRREYARRSNRILDRLAPHAAARVDHQHHTELIAVHRFGGRDRQARCALAVLEHTHLVLQQRGARRQCEDERSLGETRSRNPSELRTRLRCRGLRRDQEPERGQQQESGAACHLPTVLMTSSTAWPPFWSGAGSLTPRFSNLWKKVGRRPVERRAPITLPSGATPSWLNSNTFWSVITSDAMRWTSVIAVTFREPH